MREDILRLQRTLTEALINLEDLNAQEASLLLQEAVHEINDLVRRINDL